MYKEDFHKNDNTRFYYCKDCEYSTVEVSYKSIDREYTRYIGKNIDLFKNDLKNNSFKFANRFEIFVDKSFDPLDGCITEYDYYFYNDKGTLLSFTTKYAGTCINEIKVFIHCNLSDYYEIVNHYGHDFAYINYIRDSITEDLF
jgi:hypothetical protein